MVVAAASNDGTTATTISMTTDRAVVYALVGVLLLNVLYQVCLEAYDIRTYAIREFGRIIHEFDPYFNYRATEVSCGKRHLNRVKRHYKYCPLTLPFLSLFFLISICISTVGINSRRGLIIWFGIRWDVRWGRRFTLACK
jgi:hypothetical protein